MIKKWIFILWSAVKKKKKEKINKEARRATHCTLKNKTAQSGEGLRKINKFIKRRQSSSA